MIDRRTFLRTAATTAAATCLIPLPINAIAETRPGPNILFFFVDDMGWQDTSVPFHTEITPLNRRYHTPNMEKLVAQGMKFTQAYACAVCSPSRVSLMTGMNAARHMVTNWTLRKDRQPDPAHPKVKPARWNLNGISPTPGVDRTVHAITLPALLKKAESIAAKHTSAPKARSEKTRRTSASM